MKDQTNTPAGPAKAKLVFTYGGEEHPFDCAALGKAFQSITPIGIAIDIDEAMNLLTEYGLSDHGDIKLASVLYTLRQVRNALLKGASVIDFDDQ